MTGWRLQRSWVFALLVCGSSCSDQVIVALDPVGGCPSECGQHDLSCLEHLRVVLLGEASDDESRPEIAAQCVDVSALDDRTLCELGLADVIDLPIPDGVTAIEVTGMGPGDNPGCSGPPLFAGRAEMTEDSSAVRVPTDCVLSCAEYRDAEYLLEVTDLVTGRVPSSLDDMAIQIGLLYDHDALHVNESVSSTRFEPFVVEVVTRNTDTGVVRLEGDAFEVGGQKRHCLAARLLSDRVASAGASISCIAPSLDGAPASVLWSGQLSANRDGMADDGVLFGRVLDQGLPVAGVEVTVEPAAPSIAIAYDFDPRFAPIDGNRGRTGEDGVFVISGPFVGRVAAAGPGERSGVLAGTLPGHGAALVIAPSN
jgi:hypothetical protein